MLRLILCAFLRPKTPAHLRALVRPTPHRMACAPYVRLNDGRYMVQAGPVRHVVADLVAALVVARDAGLTLVRA